MNKITDIFGKNFRVDINLDTIKKTNIDLPDLELDFESKERDKFLDEIRNNFIKDRAKELVSFNL